MSRQSRRQAAASGHPFREQKRIVVDVDEDTFAEIKSRATAAQRSVSGVIRELIEWGLMADAAQPADGGK